MADMIDQNLREFAMEGRGFWNRIFRAITGAFGVGQNAPARLFDRAISQFGSANMRDLRTYVAGRVAPFENVNTAFPRQAADHFVRALMSSAEQLGASAEQLAAIDWENINVRDLETSDPRRILDLTQLPGLDDEMTDIMDRLSTLLGDGTDFLRQVIQDHPTNRGERMQAEREPEFRGHIAEQFEPVFTRMLRLVQSVSPDAMGPQGANVQDAFWEQAAKLLGQSPGLVRGGTGTLNEQISQAVNAMSPAHPGESRIMNTMRRMFQSAQPTMTNAGNRIFGLLPNFIQRPILNAAGRAAANAAAATGATQAGQAAAAAAGMGAARMAVAFRMVTLAGGFLVTGLGLAVAGLKKLSSAAWDTTMRVTQYSGALSMAMANNRVADLQRDIRIAQVVGGRGAARINAETEFQDKMAPMEMMVTLMGNEIGRIGTLVNSALAGAINNTMIEPLVNIGSGIVEGLAKIGLVSEETQQKVAAGAQTIVDAINANKPRDAFDPLGGQGMPVRELFNAFLNAPPQNKQAQQAAQADKPKVPNAMEVGIGAAINAVIPGIGLMK